ncbi:hypothetical protein A6R68_18949 [Neotoma lepida]|uniref:Uncharacterized protein n=1 Tax=Neotoma lepida TaxID=56216 RepID=A0A1A6HL32_NEOLE|nr:hypothetical protein A6R68_18949 [Neotoma lepida]
MAPAVARGALPGWLSVLAWGLALWCLCRAGPLWRPDRAEDCNHSWPFNLNEIQDLLVDMKIYWPDVIHPSPNRSRFWKHEWDKHGTCAAQLDALNSEKKYFGKSLDLYKQLDLNSVLQKFGIKPSINYYQGEQVQTVGQIELCFTKEDFQLRNCTEPGEQLSSNQEAWLAMGASTHGMTVCEDGPIFYPPPTKTQH